jgi:hypothetical protein
MDNTITIRVCPEDVEVMRKRCVALYLQAHPEFNRMKITDKFIFRKIIEYYATLP